MSTKYPPRLPGKGDLPVKKVEFPDESKAADSVCTWIISTGTNCGVDKAVGEAVREGQVMSWISKKEQVRAPIGIGITTWGYVKNFQDLVGKKNKGQGCYPAKYYVFPAVQLDKPVSLDPHHTHFLLVDDGTIFPHGRDMPGCDIAFRAKLEQAMITPRSAQNGLETNLKIPVVKVCIEGGMDTILATKEAVVVKIPVVVCEGTGGAADLIALAKNGKIEDFNIKEEIKRVFHISEDHSMIPKLIEALNFIAQHGSMITVFNMSDDEQVGLDFALFKALLKCKPVPFKIQLQLTMSWNRVDVAKSIFEGHTGLLLDDVYEFVTKSLRENRVYFLKLFLEKGVIMNKYLTVEMLSDLYKNEQENNKYVRKLVREVGNSRELNSVILDHVSSIIRSLTGAPLYQINESELKGELERPFTDLFLWAILGSRMDLAEFLWEGIEDQVCSAIVALRMFLSMSEKEKDPNVQLKLLDNSRKFEMLAVNLIDECFETNEKLAQRMVRIPHQLWSGMNTLQIAADSKSEDFISRPCAQAALKNVWMDGIGCSSWKVLLALIFPPLLLVIFYEKDCAPKSTSDKVLRFYNAPVSKYFGGLITYVLWLFLFSYVLIFNFESRPSFWENILFGWICTLIIEEIRQFVILKKFETCYKKVHQWMRSDWKWVNVLMLTLACVGYGLHWSSRMTEIAKGFFCASCFLSYVRLLRIYAVNNYLGPKIVMIKQMITELLYFLSILLVFMIGYGVATQSLLFPKQKTVAEAIAGVFYMPYLQILGVLFLDIYTEGKLEDCSNDPDNNQHPCPEKHPLVIILLVIYQLVGRILLLNLLIAIFSFVFGEIQSKADKIWKYERCALVMEYADRPTLAAPFNVVEHIYMVIKWLYRKSAGKQQSVNGSSYETDGELKMFEKVCAARYLWKKTNIKSSEVTDNKS
ncbi:transient receptor potential cation channel subfamily M member-like 2 [Anneissia japonica]|uniref:transient receptor potential cation channel subfamily M member-like 2 n=1 Tax=Anneissia japonica TaxID=1529436 RepID=UPI0014257197|nr:transient receptor potential cation channel subfamily M member-like 2 [Anneissia japonica]